MDARDARRATSAVTLIMFAAAAAGGIGTPASARADEAKELGPALTPSAYVETYYAYNFNRPSNGITNYRAFDNRHATFTLENAVLALDGKADRFFARVALQSGSTGETYYLAEPPRPGADGAAAGGPDVFKHVQEAYAGFGVTPRVDVQAGLYLSPIGPEAMAIKDTWLWSRSNLFYGLPFYHTGARLTWRVTDATTLRVAVLNGWNSVIDNNDTPSISAKATVTLSRRVALDIHYLGGVERDHGAPEGPAARQLVDTYLTLNATDWLDLVVNSDAGIEDNRIGFNGWAAGALFARVKLCDQLFVAARSDAVVEKHAVKDGVASGALLFPSRWLTSHAVALDLRPPVGHVSVRLEYRHDASRDALFFRGDIAGAGTRADPYVSNARSQDTLTLGMTAWF
jgi:hypothetical protein